MADWQSYRTPVPPHPFAHAVASDQEVLVSGIGGHGVDGSIAATVVEQAEAALDTITRLLNEAGSGWHEVVHFRPIVSSREHARDMDEVLNRRLPHPRPAGAALLVCDLADPRMLLEFEVTAVRGAHLVDG